MDPIIDLLERFRDGRVTRQALEETLRRSMWRLRPHPPVQVTAHDLILVLNKVQQGELSLDNLNEWIHMVWFADCFRWGDDIERLDKVMNELDELDEGDEVLSDADIDRYITLLRSDPRVIEIDEEDLVAKRKVFKYNEDDILEILSEHLAGANGFDTFNSFSILYGEPGKDLRLISVIGDLNDHEIDRLDLQEIDRQMDFNGTHE